MFEEESELIEDAQSSSNDYYGKGIEFTGDSNNYIIQCESIECNMLSRYPLFLSTVIATPSVPKVRLSDSPPITLQYSSIFSASDAIAFLISNINIPSQFLM